jgi:hypothetical protein
MREKQTVLKKLFCTQYLQRIIDGEYVDAEFDNLVLGSDSESLPLFSCVDNVVGKLGGCPSGGLPNFPPNLSIGGGLSRNFDNPELPQVKTYVGGYDGGNTVGFYGDWDFTQFDSLCRKLESNRNKGISKIDFNGVEVFLYPNSIGSGVIYRYSLEFSGIQFFIHHNPIAGIQPVRVRYGFESVVGRDFFVVNSEFKKFLSLLGFTVEKEIISNVEMQVMVDRPIIVFFEPILKDWVVRSYFKSQWFTDKTGTMCGYWGGVGTKIRIYNKYRELIDSGNELKMQLVLKFLTNGELPKDLTRIEFSVNREFLSNCRIDSCDDLKKVEHDLAMYLCTDWFRILSGAKTKGNASRQSVHIAWQEVQKLFSMFFSGVGDKKFTRKAKELEGIHCTSEQLNRQALGCLSSAIALSHGKLSSKSEILDYVSRLLDSSENRVVEKISQRTDDIRLKTGFTPIKGDTHKIEDTMVIKEVRSG